MALRDADNVDGAVALLERIAAEYPDTIDYSFALEKLGDIARERGQPARAEELYRQVLPLENRGFTSGFLQLSIAELMLADEARSLDEVVDLLEATAHRARLFHNTNFRWRMALIRLAERQGDAETQRRAARTALALLDAGAPLPRHPTIGIASADPTTVRYLKDLADQRDEP